MATVRPRFDRIWGSAGQRVDPGVTKYAQGWTAEIPTYEVLNFLQNRTDTALIAFAETGAPEWGGDVGYRRGAPVWFEGEIYFAKVQNPSRTLQPNVNPDQWGKSALNLSDADFLALSNKLSGHVNDKGNPHNVTADQVGTYRTGVIDGKIAVVQNDLAAFKARKDNPHQVTAAQAGAVPITGGAYTGPVVLMTENTQFAPSNGEYFISATTEFAGIKAGTTALGLEASTGRAIFVDGQKSYLLTELEYVEYRKTLEALYAVPPPYFEIDALSDINIKVGVGESEITSANPAAYVSRNGVSVAGVSGMPRHTQQGLLLNSQYGELLRATATGNFSGLLTFTVNIQGDWDSGNTNLLVAGDDQLILRITSDRKVLVSRRVGGAQKEYSSADALGSSAFHLTFICTPTQLQVYDRGRLVLAVTENFDPVAPSLWMHFNRYLGSWTMQSARIWAQTLTVEQITAL